MTDWNAAVIAALDRRTVDRRRSGPQDETGLSP